MNPFTCDSITLSSYDETTGLQNTARVYRVEGIDRELSIAELVMAICLNQGAKLEAEIVEMMSKMDETTRRINELTNVENMLVPLLDEGIGEPAWQFSKITGTPPSGCSPSDSWMEYVAGFGVQIDPALMNKATLTRDELQTVVTAIENQLDALNTNSQSDMIKLQSSVNKRDQSYDLDTAMVKSIATANNGIAANMR